MSPISIAKNITPPPDMAREHTASWCHPLSVIAHPFAPCGGVPCDFGQVPYTPAPALSFPGVSARAFSQGPLSGAEDCSGTAAPSLRCPYSTTIFDRCQFIRHIFPGGGICSYETIMGGCTHGDQGGDGPGGEPPADTGGKAAPGVPLLGPGI